MVRVEIQNVAAVRFGLVIAMGVLAIAVFVFLISEISRDPSGSAGHPAQPHTSGVADVPENARPDVASAPVRGVVLPPETPEPGSPDSDMGAVSIEALPEELLGDVRRIADEVRKIVPPFPSDPLIHVEAASALVEYLRYMNREHEYAKTEYRIGLRREVGRRIQTDDCVEPEGDAFDYLNELEVSGKLNRRTDHWVVRFTGGRRYVVVIRGDEAPGLDQLRDYVQSFDWGQIYRDAARYFVW